MSKIDELKQQLKEAESEETSAFGTYMYYECTDRGYDATSASEARRKYQAASMKVDQIKQEIMKLKESAMSKIQYIVLVAYDNVSCCDRCENNMVCVAICDTRKEARDIEKDILMNDKDDHIAFVHIYAGDKVKPAKLRS